VVKFLFAEFISIFLTIEYSVLSFSLFFPEFILDRGDVDSLSPWQLHLIDGHTFPHLILRTWYSHFDIAIDTTSIEDMYKTLCLLHAGRQAQVELPLVNGFIRQ